MKARTWAADLVGSRELERVRERVRAFYYWLSLRHPWAWRVRLDLVLALNLFLALLWLSLSTVTARMENPESASNLAFYIILPAVAGVGFYWAYAVLKGVRVRSATRFGAAPGPVVGVAVGLSFGCWVFVGVMSPYVALKRDVYSGAGFAEFIMGGRSYPDPNPPLERLALDVDVVRRDFDSTARRADFWDALVFDSRVPHWFVGRFDPLQESLVTFAQSRETWNNRLRALPKWRGPDMVLADPQLRREFSNSTSFEQTVIDRVAGRLSYPLPEARADVPRVITTGRDIIADAARTSLLFAEFDQAVADGNVVSPPPSFPLEVWRKLRELRFESFAKALSGSRSYASYPGGRGVPDAMKDVLRPQFDRLEHDADARSAYLRSDDYKSWRSNLPAYLGLAGLFDAEIKRSLVFGRMANEWRNALQEELGAPEWTLQLQLGQKFPATARFGLLAVLLLGLFAASVSRTGMFQTLVSIGLFVAVSSIIGGAALAVYYFVFQDHYYYPEELMLVFALVFVLTALIALTPLAVGLIRRKHVRRSMAFALAAVWGVTVFTPFVVLGDNLLETSLYYSPVTPGYVRTLLPEFANQTLASLFQAALWLLIAVGFAALVHALLARLAALPRPS